MKTTLTISNLWSNESIELKETQQKQVQGGNTQIVIIPAEGAFFSIQYIGFS